MAKDDGGPAFPIANETGMHRWALANRADETEESYIAAYAIAASGMSLRDHFAGEAIPIVFAQLDSTNPLATQNRPLQVLAAKICYEIADAMLAERRRE